MTDIAETKRYRVYLHETTGYHEAWSRTVRATNADEAIRKAVRGWFGARAFYFSNDIRCDGTRRYGQVFRRPRAGSSSDTASSSVTGTCCLDVDEV